MPINDPYAPSGTRKPRLQILKEGKAIGGALEFEVSANNFYQADTFTCRFSLFSDPEFGPDWWGTQKDFVVDLQASLDDGQSWKSMLIGEIDHISLHLVQGIVTCDGRDLTSRFIDNKTQEAFPNKTSSEVVQELATRRGLTADVTPTQALVGRYYSSDHDRISLNQFARTTTEWNMLTSLAQHEQFDIYVTGTTVHFHPSTPVDADPWLLLYDGNKPWSNAMTISLDRSMTVAKDVVVIVRSWHGAQGKGFTKAAPTGTRTAAIQSGKAQEFHFIIPNMTEAQAQDFANKKREEITRQERILQFTAPADLVLTPRSIVRLQGTGTAWDMAYYVDFVRRRLAMDAGFTMDVKCKNHSPQSQVGTT